MGIDLIRGGRIANRGFRTTKSSNSYLKSLINVTQLSFSFIHSFQEELMLNSIKLCTNVSINPDLIVIPSPSHALLNTFRMIDLPKLKVIINSSVLLRLLELLPTMLDYLTYLKGLELLLLDLLKLQETESLLPKEAAWLSINLLNSHQPEKTCCCLEVQETEKLKDISVFALVKRVHTLLLVSDQSVENSRWPEVEDDSILFK